MQQTGLLVAEWPAVLGCDVCGIVIEVGEGCTKFSKGDHIFGSSRVGQNQYASYQETFLMDEDISFKKPENVTVDAAAATGVGLLVG
jgi:NADPH:quinone reductase-like Zn-dependent oxidoreductase